jgi:hypothetical protein
MLIRGSEAFFDFDKKREKQWSTTELPAGEIAI